MGLRSVPRWLAAGGAAVAAAAVLEGAAIGQAPLPTTALFRASDAPDLWTADNGTDAVTIALGGVVTFDSATVEPHDADFGAAPVACENPGGPPLRRVPPSPETTWTGSCTFAVPGTFAFVCTVHSGMGGSVTVVAPDGAPPPAGPPPPTTPGAPPPPLGGSPLTVPPGPAVLTPTFDADREQRGARLRAVIANAGAGARATLDVAADRRDVAERPGRRGGSVRLRRVARTASADGRASFDVRLSPAITRALRRRSRLALTIGAAVSGPRVAGGTARRTLRVVLLAPGVPFTPPRSAAVAVRNDYFEPRAVTIREGGSVTWTWRSDGRSHDVVSRGWRSPIQRAGTFRRTFPRPGSYRYACSLHDGMGATVTVRARPLSARRPAAR